MNAETAALIDAAAEGTKAGEYGRSASMNPYQAGTKEHEVWENARAAYIGFTLNTRVLMARSTY